MRCDVATTIRSIRQVLGPCSLTRVLVSEPKHLEVVSVGGASGAPWCDPSTRTDHFSSVKCMKRGAEEAGIGSREDGHGDSGAKIPRQVADLAVSLEKAEPDAGEIALEQAEQNGLMYGGGEKGEGQFVAFNLNEERTMGTISKSGEFTWNTRQLGDDAETRNPEDAWLDGNEVLSQQQLETIQRRNSVLASVSTEEHFDKLGTLKIVESLLQANETVDSAIRRLGKPSSSEEGRGKKAIKKKASWRDRRKKLRGDGSLSSTVTTQADTPCDNFLELTSAVTKLLVEGNMPNIYNATKDDIGREIVLSK